MWEADKEYQQPQNLRAYDTTQFARETFVEAEETVPMESQMLDDPSLIDHEQI